MFCKDKEKTNFLPFFIEFVAPCKKSLVNICFWVQNMTLYLYSKELVMI